MSNHKPFLEELKVQLERHLDARHNIDKKAYNMIAISGTIATLLSGFGLALNRIIDPKSFVFSILLLFILIGICCMLVTIIFSLRSYTIRNQTNPIVHNPFYNDNGKGTYNDTVVKEYVDNISEEQFDLTFIESYLDSIRSASDAIEHKSTWLVRSQWVFLGGIFVILITGAIYGFVYFSITEKISSVFQPIISDNSTAIKETQ